MTEPTIESLKMTETKFEQLKTATLDINQESEKLINECDTSNASHEMIKSYFITLRNFYYSLSEIIKLLNTTNDKTLEMLIEIHGKYSELKLQECGKVVEKEVEKEVEKVPKKIVKKKIKVVKDDGDEVEKPKKVARKSKTKKDKE